MGMNMPPPPPPPPGQPGGQPGYPQASNVREHPDGTTVLVLGILGLVVCAVLAPIAWVKGNAAKREIDAQPHVNWTNAGAVSAGRICGIIGSVLLIIGVAILVLFFIAIAASSA
jgi:hypothetical protein